MRPCPEKNPRFLVITDKSHPSDHSFVQNVLERMLGEEHCQVTIFGESSRSAGRFTWNGTHYRLYKRLPGGMLTEILQKVIRFPFFLWSEHSFDVIFTRNDPVGLLLARILCFRHPNMIHLHQISFLHSEFLRADPDCSPFDMIKSTGDRAIRRMCLRFVDKVFAVSPTMREDLERVYGLPPGRIGVLSLGVNTDEFQDALEYLSRPMDAVYVGTLASARKPEMMVDAVRIYIERYGPLILHVWGKSHNPRDDAEFVRYVESRGMGKNVVWHGQVPRKEVISQMKRAKVGLSPIPAEGVLIQGSPTKLMEYLAAGCCVAGFRGIPDQDAIIRESGAGLLVRQDPNDLAEAIYRILSRPEMSSRMSEKGRKYIFEHRDYKAVAKDLFLTANVLVVAKTGKR